MCSVVCSLLVSTLILCTSLTRIGVLLFAQTVNSAPVVIRGRNEFVPCTYERDPTDVRAHILLCDEDASREFGQQLPIIQADQIALSQILIRGTTNIITCPDRAFQDVNVDLDRARGQMGSVVRVVEISGTGLAQIEPNCLDGLFTVRELRILNAPGSEHAIHGSQLAQNLFHGLRGMRNLQFLHLMHVDLSGGIPANGLGNWTEELRKVHLEYNRLQQIDKDAFIKSGPYGSVLTELRIEAQPEAWRLVKNMHEWARTLTSLRILSLKRSQLQPPTDEGMIRIDLGEAANAQLVSLSLDDCGLLRLVSEQSAIRMAGLSLDALGPHLQELSINQNNFASLESVDQSLIGLRSMSNLRLLRIEYNKTPLNRLPDWFPYGGLNRLRELRLRNSGLISISAATFPPSLEVLHLSANPLRYVDEAWMSNNKQGLTELHLNHIRLASVDVGGYWGDWARAFQPVSHTLHLLSLAGCQIEPEVLDEPLVVSNVKQPGPNNSTLGKPPIRLGLRDLKQLRTLVLNDNELTYIPPNAFSELTKLRHLVLAGNQLGLARDSTVNRRSGSSKLTSRHRLQRLDLRFNQLQSLDRCANDFGLEEPLEDMLPQRPTWLAGESGSTGVKADRSRDLNFGEIKEDRVADVTEWFGGLSLTGNPFVCDCRLAWLRLYVSQMDRHVAQSTLDNALPLGYRTYRSEALDFVCADVGPWRGRTFLSLKSIDLYAARHDRCQQRPDIYGVGAQMEQTLIPCREVLMTYADDEPRGRGRMLFTTGFVPGNRSNQTTTSLAKTLGFAGMGMSMEAFILIIVAGVASLCFIIVSIGIIVWLCVRLRRQTSQHKQGFYSRGQYISREGNKTRSLGCCDPPSYPCTCCFCSSRARHSAATTTTMSGSNSTAVTAIPKQSVLVQNTYSRDSELRLTSQASSSEVGSVYEEPIESYYSQMSDTELGITQPQSQTVQQNKVDGGAKPIPMKRKLKRNNPTAQRRIRADTQQTDRAVMCDDDSQGIVAPKQLGLGRAENRFTIYKLEGARSTASLDQVSGARPQRTAPLPPVPTQRKTKSIADIQANLIDQFGLSVPYDPRQYRHAASMNAVSMAGLNSGKRSQTTVVPEKQDQVSTTMRAKQNDSPTRNNRHTDGSVQRVEQQLPFPPLARTRLTKSTGPRIRAEAQINRSDTSSGSGWLRASRKKLQRSLNWFRRQSARASTPQNILEPSTIVTDQRGATHQDDEDENLKHMQGPDLPRPQFVIPKSNKNPSETIAVKVPHEYLPMKMGDRESEPADPIPLVRETTNDEYVTELADHQQNLLRAVRLNRRPSKSDGEQHSVEPKVRLRRPPLRLSDNIYTLSLYDDAPDPELGDDPMELDLPPPPPPPPPSKMIARIPAAAWVRQKPVTHKPTQAACPNNNNINRCEHRQDGGKENTSEFMPQPLDSHKTRSAIDPRAPDPQGVRQHLDTMRTSAVDRLKTSVDV